MAAKKQYPNYIQDAEECKRFLSGYTDSNGARKYMEMLQQVANRERITFPISLDDVHDFSGAEFLSKVLSNAKRYIVLFSNVADALVPKPTVLLIDNNPQDALTTQRLQRIEAVRGAEDTKSKLPAELTRRFELVLIPPTTTKPKKLRQIKADDVGRLLLVSGIITRVTEVKPLIRVMCYICGICGFECYQEVNDKQFSPLTVCPSPECKQNKTDGKLYQQTRGSKFIKYQDIKLQELPTEVPVGNIPRTLTLKAYGEATRQCKPGDFVTITGIFLPEPYRGYRAVRAGLTAEMHLEIMNVELHKKVSVDWDFSPELLKQIEEKAEDKDIYDQLSASIAPEIFGLTDVKKALLLLLVGGMTRRLADVTIRGDINMLMMGDPGVAKSQLLKHISRLAPRAVYTTGKGSSGVGLTAAVTRDNLTGEMALEGGALVLADKGVCCIDEFDKMEEADRTAIHEVMEQQTVSIAKAGITTQLNARTAILAAANPVFGRYNPQRSPESNLGLPTSILSRFDLTFIMRDRPDEDFDEALARHVTFVHREEKAPEAEVGFFNEEFLRAYISRAKQFTAFVPPELAEELIQNYVAMRKEEPMAAFREESKKNYNDRQRFCTPRSLLSILRLAQALARVHFRNKITKDDVEEAMRLVEVSRQTEDKEEKGRRDPITAIYNIIREYLSSRQRTELKLSEVEPKILRTHNREQLTAVLDRYEDLGIWKLSKNRDRLTLHPPPKEGRGR